MTIHDPRHRQDVFAVAFASMRQAACIVERVQQGRDGDCDWRYIAFNPAMQRMFQVTDLAGLVLRNVHPDLACEWHAYLERVATAGKAETIIRQFGRKPMLLRIELSPLSPAGGDPILVQIWNITSKNVVGKPPKIDAAEQKTQTIDTQHQIRNVMSKVSSVARLSAASHLRVDDYVDHLSGRLQAMGRTQSMLARLPNTRLDLAELLDEELLANAVDRDRCIAEGPYVALAPHAAEIVTLVIHELATNSIKFGALGDKGIVLISWTTGDRDQVPWLSLSWDETSSQHALTPLRKGFGTCLIEERIAYELQGEGRLRVHEAGVHAEFAFPLA
jgi:two-component sensor histidine kinase